MRWLFLLALLVPALWLVDRALVWCELRGWIVYRLTPRPSTASAVGNALLNLDELFRPASRQVAELKLDQAVHREDDEAGAGGRPGAGRMGR